MAFLSTHGFLFAWACVMVPALTADALAMVRSFIASAPISAMVVPRSTAERMAMMASAVRPAMALSATEKAVTCGFEVRYRLTRSRVMGSSSKSKHSWEHMAAISPALGEHRDELLGGQWLDAAVLPLEYLQQKVEFRLRFLQVGDRLLARARLDELVEQPFALDPSFMPADDDAGCTRIGACLTAVAPPWIRPACRRRFADCRRRPRRHRRAGKG